MKVNAKTSPGTSKSLTGSDNSIVYKALSVSSPPTVPQSVVNKEYLDEVYGPALATTGDICFSLSPQTPEGYLRCNGGVVSKAAYADLYSVIGDSFYPSSRIGNGKPHVHQYDINNLLSRELYSWANSGKTLTASNAYTDCVVTKNRVFIFGRFTGSTHSSTCYTAAIGSNGLLGDWTTSGSLPLSSSAAQTLIFNNYVYVIGGYNGSSARNTVYRATVSSTGTLSGWSTLTALPFTVYRSQMFVTKNHVYIVGGIINGASSGLVYFSEIDASGNLGAWASGPSLPVNVADHSVVVIKKRAYVLGGVSSGVDTAYCWVGNIDSQGNITDWVPAESLPETVKLSTVVCVKNRVYLLGGVVNGSASSKVYSAPITSDGTVGSWEIYGDLITSIYAATACLTSSKLYIIGGYRAGSVSAVIDSIDATGGLNDYSSYYGEGVYPTDQNTFMLPDYSGLEYKDKMYVFVKT